jgi:hypothetical protein
VNWCSWRACDGGRERGKEKGWAASAMSFIGAAGGRGRRGVRGLARWSTAGTGPWLMDAGRRHAHAVRCMTSAKTGEGGG